MKKLVGLLIVMSLVASVHAGLDIGFSTNNGGHWSYTASGVGEGTFSFAEAGVDNVQGTEDTSLSSASVYIQKLTVSLSKYPVYQDVYVGIITPEESSTISIKNGNENGNGNGNNILTGNLGEGAIVVVGTTASLYPRFNAEWDITKILWNKGTGPNLMDFSLTLQGGDIAAMIRGNQDNEAGGTFSGSMTAPEPATMFILAIGSALMWKNKK